MFGAAIVHHFNLVLEYARTKYCRALITFKFGFQKCCFTYASEDLCLTYMKKHILANCFGTNANK